MPYRILAPAKVNLTLEVTGLLPGGYHELDTIFCWLELADVLQWQEADTASLALSGSDGRVFADEDNLVMRALRLLEKKTSRALPVAFLLHKNIPAGGGLGGGSSDAAAVLVGLNLSHRLGLDPSELEEWGGELGADVAFCVAGGTARGRGRGERLEALPAPAARAIILACPSFGCPTPEIYRRWDQSRDRMRCGASQELQQRLQEGQEWLDLLSNDLQPPAENYRPQLQKIRQGLLDEGCTHSMLSGSGSTVLGFPPVDKTELVMGRLQQRQDNVRYQATRLSGRPRPPMETY